MRYPRWSGPPDGPEMARGGEGPIRGLLTVELGPTLDRVLTSFLLIAWLASLMFCHAVCVSWSQPKKITCICDGVNPMSSINSNSLAIKSACCSVNSAKCPGWIPSHVDAVLVGKLLEAFWGTQPSRGQGLLDHHVQEVQRGPAGRQRLPKVQLDVGLQLRGSWKGRPDHLPLR